jgi:hypothetical protein
MMIASTSAAIVCFAFTGTSKKDPRSSRRHSGRLKVSFGETLDLKHMFSCSQGNSLAF